MNKNFARVVHSFVDPIGFSRKGWNNFNRNVAFSTASADKKRHYILEYHYVDNMLELRGPVRPVHLKYTEPFVADGTLVAGGALLPDAKRGLILLYAENKNVVEAFVKHDPYFTSKLVQKYEILEWGIVAGRIPASL